jgi:hypothetical protein
MKKKRSNPQDATLRNIRAVNKKLKQMEDWVQYMADTLNDRIDLMHKRMSSLEKKIKKGKGD